jgi:hypothetical protein
VGLLEDDVNPKLCFVVRGLLPGSNIMHENNAIAAVLAFKGEELETNRGFVIPVSDWRTMRGSAQAKTTLLR